MTPLRIAGTIAMTGAGATIGTMVAAEKNDMGFHYSGDSAEQTFLGMGIGAAMGGAGVPLAAKLIKGSVIGRIR